MALINLFAWEDSASRLLEILGSALVIVAVLLIASLDIRGQYIMLAAQGVWAAFAIRRRMIPLAVQSVVLGGLTIIAIVNWTTAAR